MAAAAALLRRLLLLHQQSLGKGRELAPTKAAAGQEDAAAFAGASGHSSSNIHTSLMTAADGLQAAGAGQNGLGSGSPGSMACAAGLSNNIPYKDSSSSSSIQQASSSQTMPNGGHGEEQQSAAPGSRPASVPGLDGCSSQVAPGDRSGPAPSLGGPCGEASGSGAGSRAAGAQRAMLSRLWTAAEVQTIWRGLLAVCDWRDWRAREGEDW